MDTKALEEIGLTNAEIKLYLSLLELGNSSAGNIIDRSGLQNSVFHLTINKLIDKGLVSYTYNGKKKNYQAINPKHLLNYIEEKKSSIEKILPNLIKISNSQNKKPDIITFEGINGIRELLYTLLDSNGKEHHTFGSSFESLILGEGWWVEYHKKRAKKGIEAKLLFNESLKSWVKENKYPKTKYKFTKKGFEPLTETIIRGDKIGIILWLKKPLGIIIQNEIAAKSYDNFFNLLWNQN